MNNTVTLSGNAAMMAKYIIALARVEFPEFSEMSDEEILSRIIDMGIDSSREVEK